MTESGFGGAGALAGGGAGMGRGAPLVAVTGATGFIGRRLVPALAAAGFATRLLLRRDPVVREWRSVKPQVVAGGLDDAAALKQLVDGAQVVIHVAGLIKAARRAHFLAANRDGSAALARTVARIAPRAHFLHVSSLAAREPSLSDYAASKRAGEEVVLETLRERATVLRPPAIYGPGDRESMIFFQLARGKRIPLLGAPEARAAMMHVDDLTGLMVALAAGSPQGGVLTTSDSRPGGYRWNEILTAAAGAVGNAHPRLFQAPLPLLRLVALAGDIGRAFGSANMLSSQKLREVRHADWSVAGDALASAPGWSPRFTLEAGFADAVRWYRSAGWLP